MSSAQIGDLQANRMAINQLVRFFQFNLVFGAVTQFQRAFQSCFRFSLDDVVAAVGFIDKHPQRFGRNFDDAAADSIIVQFVIRIAFSVTDGNRARNRQTDKRFVTGKYRDFTGGGWQNDFINIFVDFGAEEGNKLEIHYCHYTRYSRCAQKLLTPVKRGLYNLDRSPYSCPEQENLTETQSQAINGHNQEREPMFLYHVLAFYHQTRACAEARAEQKYEIREYHSKRSAKRTA